MRERADINLPPWNKPRKASGLTGTFPFPALNTVIFLGHRHPSPSRESYDGSQLMVGFDTVKPTLLAIVGHT